jgi:hypothetical protein
VAKIVPTKTRWLRTTKPAQTTPSARKSSTPSSGGSVISRLPTGGDYPFEPKKGQRLNNPESIKRQNGNPVDKYGQEWDWDPIKEEFDVQNSDKHTNIGPDGKITHGENNTGRSPKPADDESGTASSVGISPEAGKVLLIGGVVIVGFLLLPEIAFGAAAYGL